MYSRIEQATKHIKDTGNYTTEMWETSLNSMVMDWNQRYKDDLMISSPGKQIDGDGRLDRQIISRQIDRWVDDRQRDR